MSNSKDSLDIQVGLRIKASGNTAKMALALTMTSVFFGGFLALWAGGMGSIAIAAALISPVATYSAAYLMMRDTPQLPQLRVVDDPKMLAGGQYKAIESKHYSVVKVN